MENLLEVKNISKKYSGFELKDVTFNIPKGTVMGIIGENGAGKSTIINSILGLINKDSGKVLFDGKEFDCNSKEIKEYIGVVFDEINFHDTLNAKKIEKISRAAYKNWNTDLFFSYMTKFNLPLDKKIKDFSKGMKMKLSIAVALSHKAKLLILDEATNGLDPVMRDDILDIFWDFVQDENNSILIASHITSDLEKIADYITFLHDGKVIFSKEKDELLYDYGILRCGEKVFKMLENQDIVRYRKKEYEYEVLVKDKNSAKHKYIDAIIDNSKIDDILLLYIKGECIK